MSFGPREGEIALAADPATMPPDGHVVFIGRIRSPWQGREDCPKNMGEARATGRPASAEIDEPYRQGLAGLERASHVILLTWLDRSPRNLIVQKPRHATEAKGVFALRSPARPNPIGLSIATIIGVDVTSGIIGLDAMDLLDGTPLIDVKPYFPSVDAYPDAMSPHARDR